MKELLIDSYDYPLPQDRIAQHPLAQRDACKLLMWRDGVMSEKVFSELPGLLPPDAVMVCNNTRVINARLRFRKSTGALIEVFCLEPVSPVDYAENFAASSSCEWLCFVGNSKRWKEGALTGEIRVGAKVVTLSAERMDVRGNARVVRFSWTGDVSFSEVISAAGEIPIPPYLNRSTEKDDSTDYQTVYSHVEGSVAAPTAGLHFTPEVLSRIEQRGIPILEVTLHVGAGTFQPVKTADVAEHRMHSEFFAVDKDVILRLAEAVRNNRPIVAVGTTSVRTLESLYHAGCMVSDGVWSGEVPQWYPYDSGHAALEPYDALCQLADYLESEHLDSFIGSTRIIIVPGYEYKIVSGIITNFHQPRSTLLLLVSAFMGGDSWRDLYRYALDNDFRFLSYGDAAFLSKS